MSLALRWLLLLLALSSVLLTALAAHHGFFWDALLQASRYGQWYYHTNFTQPLVPEAYDAGHPPLFGIALAVLWKLFGVALPVGHWAMLPLVLGVLWQCGRLVRRFLPAGWQVPGLLLLWLDATWLGQSTLVSPDVAVLFCYLLSINGIVARRPWQIAAGTLPLVLLSSRGLMLLLALLLTAACLEWLRQQQPDDHRKPLPLPPLRALLRVWRPFAPALLLVGAWLLLHFRLTGWVGYHATSPWAANTARVGLAGVARNAVLIVWRLLDVGRLALWLAGLTALGLLLARGWRPRPVTWQLLALWLPPVLLMSGTMLWYANPIGHRYYLPTYLLFALLTAHLLAELPAQLPARRLAALALLGLLSGHFWVYPDHIANGWDASLAHWPYFRLRQQMLTWLDQQRIPLAAVGSGFPNSYSLHDTDLVPDQRRFAPIDLRRNRYVLQSNVMNLNDAVLDTLSQQWHLVHEARSGQVYFRLYRRP